MSEKQSHPRETFSSSTTPHSVPPYDIGALKVGLVDILELLPQEAKILLQQIDNDSAGEN